MTAGLEELPQPQICPVCGKEHSPWCSLYKLRPPGWSAKREAAEELRRQFHPFVLPLRPGVLRKCALAFKTVIFGCLSARYAFSYYRKTEAYFLVMVFALSCGLHGSTVAFTAYKHSLDDVWFWIWLLAATFLGAVLGVFGFAFIGLKVSWWRRRPFHHATAYMFDEVFCRLIQKLLAAVIWIFTVFLLIVSGPVLMLALFESSLGFYAAAIVGEVPFLLACGFTIWWWKRFSKIAWP